MNLKINIAKFQYFRKLKIIKYNSANHVTVLRRYRNDCFVFHLPVGYFYFIFLIKLHKSFTLLESFFKKRNFGDISYLLKCIYFWVIGIQNFIRNVNETTHLERNWSDCDLYISESNKWIMHTSFACRKNIRKKSLTTYELNKSGFAFRSEVSDIATRFFAYWFSKWKNIKLYYGCYCLAGNYRSFKKWFWKFFALLIILIVIKY